jgi:hypothetical protein
MQFEEAYVGLDVFSTDSERLGRVKDVCQDPSTMAEYLIVERADAHDLAIPFSVMERPGDRLIAPYTKSFLDRAPNVDVGEHSLSSDDARRLDDFYVRRAA